MENSSFNWQVVGASVIGTSHEKRSQPCQDAHCWRLLPHGVLVASVADGAGSAALAEVGAKIAVEGVVETICQEQERRQPTARRGFGSTRRSWGKNCCGSGCRNDLPATGKAASK